jgi:hypothetical protein
MKKKILASLALGVCGIGLIAGNATATMLTNTEMTVTQYDSVFDSVWVAAPGNIVGTFDFGNDGVYDGVIYSGVEKSDAQVNGQWLYSYFYSVEVYSNSSHDVTSLSIDWGSNAPYALDINGDNALDTSFWGKGNWNQSYTDVDNPAFGATYNPVSGTVNFSFFGDNSIKPGEQSSWLMLISPQEFGTTTFNVTNGGPGEVVGVVYAPVPEPATMLLFGTGIASLAGVIRRRRK